jgi:hypothetical protein
MADGRQEAELRGREACVMSAESNESRSEIVVSNLISNHYFEFRPVIWASTSNLVPIYDILTVLYM